MHTIDGMHMKGAQAGEDNKLKRVLQFTIYTPKVGLLEGGNAKKLASAVCLNYEEHGEMRDLDEIIEEGATKYHEHMLMDEDDSLGDELAVVSHVRQNNATSQNSLQVDESIDLGENNPNMLMNENDGSSIAHVPLIKHIKNSGNQYSLLEFKQKKQSFSMEAHLGLVLVLREDMSGDNTQRRRGEGSRLRKLQMVTTTHDKTLVDSQKPPNLHL
ncbi:hypothetical protein F2Q70_00027261 [Brassica cretica]|uniref:Uncharacterized protein n=2 Tax=Brassica cretica TaxID=69181 RepID=A0A8S9LGT3_BRACR|nr:hypothetical protein F2Q70_00027261 [Brassica cretica]